MNNTNNIQSEGIHISEFERRIPETAKLKQVRLDERRCVVFAMGYNKEETVAVIWYKSGKAWARPMSVKTASRFVEGQGMRIFNGHTYNRSEEYDLI